MSANAHSSQISKNRLIRLVLLSILGVGISACGVESAADGSFRSNWFAKHKNRTTALNTIPQRIESDNTIPPDFTLLTIYDKSIYIPQGNYEIEEYDSITAIVHPLGNIILFKPATHADHVHDMWQDHLLLDIAWPANEQYVIDNEFEYATNSYTDWQISVLEQSPATFENSDQLSSHYRAFAKSLIGTLQRGCWIHTGDNLTVIKFDGYEPNLGKKHFSSIEYIDSDTVLYVRVEGDSWESVDSLSNSVLQGLITKTPE